MKKLFKVIRNLFKQKCPNCKGIMDCTNEFYGSQVYSCKNCKNEWF